MALNHTIQEHDMCARCEQYISCFLRVEGGGGERKKKKSNSVKSLIVTRSKHPILLTFIFMHHLVSVIKNRKLGGSDQTP